MLRITLGRGEEKRIKAGHQWIFSNEISDIRGEKSPGAAAEIYDASGSYLGTGYYNPASLIAVRLLARSRADIDTPQLYRERITRALELRRSIYPGLESFRVVHGEGDFLPGLVVDKYGEYLSVQFLTSGMDSRAELLTGVLREIFSPKGIIARNDVSVRGLEGLSEEVSVLYGDTGENLEIEEHSLRFRVDLLRGQKTGHFLDQKENHLLLKGIAKGREVLDCFCYSGSWGIHAAAYGARRVLCIDSSERAIANARQNASVNDFDKVVGCEVADAFEKLRNLNNEGRGFDLVVLDPPAFVKSRKNLKEAEKGYLTINRRAMELIRPGGYLISCSCSYHMGRERFHEILASAARQARKEMRLVEVRSQAPDHPILLSMPESEYLKCFVLQTV
jgi:23S rRNA (cytosine1962-C5)-methyltransferase